LDVHTVMGGAYEGSVYQNVLFQNPGGWNNNWVGLSLKGMQTNKLALGARIEVVLETGTSIYRTISSGGSFGGNPFDQMIGIGKANKIKTIHIFWPGSRTTQTLSEIDPNVWYHVTENESIQKNE